MIKWLGGALPVVCVARPLLYFACGGRNKALVALPILNGICSAKNLRPLLSDISDDVLDDVVVYVGSTSLVKCT